jgi:hypothetical protein
MASKAPARTMLRLEAGAGNIGVSLGKAILFIWVLAAPPVRRKQGSKHRGAENRRAAASKIGL